MLLGIECHVFNYLRQYGAMPPQRFIERGNTSSAWVITVGRWQVIVSRVK